MVSDSDLCCTADLLLFTPYISVLAEKTPGSFRVTGTPHLFLPVQTLFCLISLNRKLFLFLPAGLSRICLEISASQH